MTGPPHPPWQPWLECLLVAAGMAVLLWCPQPLAVGFGAMAVLVGGVAMIRANRTLGLAPAPARDFLVALAVTTPLALAMLAFAHGHHRPWPEPGQLGLTFGRYLLKAFGQEWLMWAVVYRRLAGSIRARRAGALVCLLFAATHLPNGALVLLTAALAPLWLWLYLRHESVWPPLLSHAILGALADDVIDANLRVGHRYWHRPGFIYWLGDAAS